MKLTNLFKNKDKTNYLPNLPIDNVNELTFDDIISVLSTIEYPYHVKVPVARVIDYLYSLTRFYDNVHISYPSDLPHYARKFLVADKGTEIPLDYLMTILYSLQIVYEFSMSPKRETVFDIALRLTNRYDRVPQLFAQMLFTHLSEYEDDDTAYSNIKNYYYHSYVEDKGIKYVSKQSIVHFINSRSKKGTNMDKFNHIPTVKEFNQQQSTKSAQWVLEAKDELLNWFNQIVVTNASTTENKAVLDSYHYPKAYDLLTIQPEYLTDKGYRLTFILSTVRKSGDYIGSPFLEVPAFTVTWDRDTKLIKAILY